MSTNENDGLQKNELIAKLEEIAALYRDTVAIKSKMNNFVPEDNYERKVIVPIFPGDYEDEEEREELESSVDHTEDDAIEQMTQEYDRSYCPREPQKPNIGKPPVHQTPLTDEHKKKKGCLPIGAIFIAVCSLISGGLFSGDKLTIIFNFVIIVACAITVLRFYMKIKEFKKADEEVTKLTIEGYEASKKEKEQKYEQDMKEYQSLLTSYKLSRADFIEEYSAWRDAYLKSEEEERDIRRKLETDRSTEVDRIKAEEFVPAVQALTENNNLIAKEYLPAIDTIIKLLKSGRADDLKEAINLYEEILYKERQLQLEKEKEAQRQREAKLQREAEERHHQENMKFQQQQEYNRQKEAEKQLAAAERQHQAEMDLMKKQEENRRREAQANRQKRCVWCAHKLTCREQYYEGAYNCTGFTPKQ